MSTIHSDFQYNGRYFGDFNESACVEAFVEECERLGFGPERIITYWNACGISIIGHKIEIPGRYEDQWGRTLSRGEVDLVWCYINAEAKAFAASGLRGDSASLSFTVEN